MSDEVAAKAGRNIAHALKRAFRPRTHSNPLWPSNLGKPDCQLWFMAKDAPTEPILPHTKIKFLIGDFLESLVMALVEYAGHEVTEEQAVRRLHGYQLNEEGLTENISRGRIDAKVDGEIIDVKSASTFGFKKFKEGTLHNDDPFGYHEQLGVYTQSIGDDGIVDKPKLGGWLAIDKQHGHLSFLRADTKHIPDMRKRLDDVARLTKQDHRPPRGFALVPEGNSGNMKLGVTCSYCQYKQVCYEDANDGQGLRAFLYSTGPRFFAVVRKEPNVLELKLGDGNEEADTA